MLMSLNKAKNHPFQIQIQLKFMEIVQGVNIDVSADYL